MITPDIVKNSLIEVLNEIQLNNGQPPIEINDDTCPSLDLLGFESIHMIEASALLTVKLGHDINAKMMLSGSDQGAPVTVNLIVSRIMDDLRN